MYHPKMLDSTVTEAGILPTSSASMGSATASVSRIVRCWKAGGGMMPATAKVGSDLGHIEVTLGAQVAAHLGIAVDAL